MNLEADGILKVMRDKRVENWHHANTLRTSCTFLENGHLLSRSYVEANGLIQTPQYTDEVDKKYRIYDCLFFDSVDIHQRAHRRNKYGPILFVFKLDFVLTLPKATLRITKKNPSKWIDSDRIEDRFFVSEDDLKSHFKKGCFDQMLVIETHNSKVELLGSLIKLIIDDPKMHWLDNGKGLLTEALETMQIAAASGGLQGKGLYADFRTCDRHYCDCINEYTWLNNIDRIVQVFR